jgi:hypothetical protein
MPICTRTISKSALATDTKTAPAREMARIHSSVNHVPSIYVNVVFTSYRQVVFTPTIADTMSSLLPRRRLGRLPPRREGYASPRCGLSQRLSSTELCSGAGSVTSYVWPGSRQR